MSEPIPPIWFSLAIGTNIILYDEGTALARIVGLNFVGEHVAASIIPDVTAEGLRGVVTIKNENPIGDDAPSPAYFTSHGSFSIPTNSGTVAAFTHTQDTAYNISLVSGTHVTPMHTGLFYFEAFVWGETTEDICAEDPSRPSPANFENKFYRYGPAFRHSGPTGLLKFGFGNACTFAVENCHFGGSLVSLVRGLSRMTPGDSLSISVVLEVFGVASPPPFHQPSSAGEFTFSMQRVSLGT